MITERRFDAGEGPLHIWQAALNDGRFLLQSCGACGKHVFYPRVLCPHCGRSSLDWVAASGHGNVHSFTIVARKPELGGDYNVVLVDLDEGVRLMSKVQGVNSDQVYIGMRVQHDIIRDGEDAVLVFRPSDAAVGGGTSTGQPTEHRT